MLVAPALPRGVRVTEETGIPVATVNLACAAISLPWSQVMLFRKNSGRVAIFCANTIATRSAVRS